MNFGQKSHNISLSLIWMNLSLCPTIRMGYWWLIIIVHWKMGIGNGNHQSSTHPKTIKCKKYPQNQGLYPPSFDHLNPWPPNTPEKFNPILRGNPDFTIISSEINYLITIFVITLKTIRSNGKRIGFTTAFNRQTTGTGALGILRKNWNSSYYMINTKQKCQNTISKSFVNIITECRTGRDGGLKEED